MVPIFAAIMISFSRQICYLLDYFYSSSDYCSIVFHASFVMTKIFSTYTHLICYSLKNRLYDILF